MFSSMGKLIQGQLGLGCKENNGGQMSGVEEGKWREGRRDGIGKKWNEPGLALLCTRGNTAQWSSGAGTSTDTR